MGHFKQTEKRKLKAGVDALPTSQLRPEITQLWNLRVESQLAENHGPVFLSSKEDERLLFKIQVAEFRLARR